MKQRNLWTQGLYCELWLACVSIRRYCCTLYASASDSTTGPVKLCGSRRQELWDAQPPQLLTDVFVGQQVRYANRPGERRPLSAGPAATLSEVDRRRIFFTRGPPGISAEAVAAAFASWGEVSVLALLLPCAVPVSDIACTGMIRFQRARQAWQRTKSE